MGLQSAHDARFCPSVFYFKNLAIYEAEVFELYSPSLKITETKVHNMHGPEKLVIQFFSNIPMDSMIISNYIRRTMNNITELRIISGNFNYKLTFFMGQNLFEGKSKLKKLEFHTLKVKGLTAESFNDLPILEDLVFEYIDLDDFKFFR